MEPNGRVNDSLTSSRPKIAKVAKIPRGSRKGERRGGRQRGTPNKKTLLMNAVFLAAAADPNTSPLNFILAVMRDPNVPTDLRLEMAVTAAPYVHAKPQAPSRVRTNPMDLSPIKTAPDFTGQKMEGKLRAPEQCGGGGADLSPLNYLLSVMKDANATAKQQIKAARVAMRYTHVAIPPDKMPAVDEYGFSISRTLAKTIADDWLRMHHPEIQFHPDHPKHAKEIAEIEAREAERDEFLECPAGYSAKRDLKRREELVDKRWRGETSMAEETELAHVVARITASEAGFNRSPEGKARRRSRELTWKRDEPAAGGAEPVGLTPAEDSELQQLYKDFPSLLPPVSERPPKNLAEAIARYRNED